MPIYEYRCNRCGKLQEVLVNKSIGTVRCLCGGITVKVISPCNVHYRAKGFYNTDKKEGDSI